MPQATYQLQWPATNPKRLAPRFVPLAEAETGARPGQGTGAADVCWLAGLHAWWVNMAGGFMEQSQPLALFSTVLCFSLPTSMPLPACR